MERTFAEYRRLAKRLSEDKPITACGQVVCWRKADERETDASKAILELIDSINEAIADLEAFSVCGTCGKYRSDPVNGPHCEKKRHQQDDINCDTSACCDWKWKGKTLEADREVIMPDKSN